MANNRLEIKIDTQRYQELIRNTEELKGILSEDAPALTVASVAIIGRGDADARIAGIIHMGSHHYKVRKDGTPERKVWSVKRSDLKAWASTRRKNKQGNPWLLSRYSWETVAWKNAKRPKVTASFTSNIANLFAVPSKVYTADSPWFETGSGYRGRVQKGQRRVQITRVWNVTVQSVTGARDKGVARAERKLLTGVEL